VIVVKDATNHQTFKFLLPFFAAYPAIGIYSQNKILGVVVVPAQPQQCFPMME